MSMKNVTVQKRKSHRIGLDIVAIRRVCLDTMQRLIVVQVSERNS